MKSASLSFSRWLGAAGSGMASALPCYIEYLGLGAVLGTALLGYGASSQGMGALLVIASAAITCLWLAWRRIPMIAGPRAASLSVLVLSLWLLQQFFGLSAAQQTQAMLALMLGHAGTQWVCSHAWCMRLFRWLPAWLMPAFTYASGIAMVASSTKKYAWGCLQAQPAWTWLVLLAGIASGVLWGLACTRVEQRFKQRQRVRSAKVAGSLKGLNLLVGPGVAWLCFEASPLVQAAAGQCARLGHVELNAALLLTRALDVVGSAPVAWALLAALCMGTVTGAITCIESVVAIRVIEKEAPDSPQAGPKINLTDRTPATMRSMAGSQVVCAVAAHACASIAQARTLLMHQLYPRSSLAVAFHALGLLLIAGLASRWIAYLPQLALTVVIALVAINMITKETVRFWQQAYNPDALLKRYFVAGIGIWLVIGLTAISQQSLTGFLLPALAVLAMKYGRLRKRRMARNP